MKKKAQIRYTVSFLILAVLLLLLFIWNINAGNEKTGKVRYLQYLIGSVQFFFTFCKYLTVFSIAIQFIFQKKIFEYHTVGACVVAAGFYMVKCR